MKKEKRENKGVQIIARIDEELRHQLRILAANENKSLNLLVQEAIEKMIKDKKDIEDMFTYYEKMDKQ